MTSTSSNELPLNANEARQLAAVVAEVAGADLPLSYGLRAVADEAASRRLASVLSDLADRCEKGQSLADAMEGLGNRVPSFVRELMVMASRTGQLANTLNEFVDHQQRAQELLRGMRRALTYPLIVLAAALLVAMVLPAIVTPQFASLYSDFDLKLPPITETIIWIGNEGVYYMLAAAILIGLSLGSLRWFGGEVSWRSMLAEIPLLGCIWYWSSVSQMCRLIAMLIEAGLPLPQALAVAESGIDNLALRQATRRIAEEAEKGRSLGELLRTTFYWPRSMAPFLDWGERNSSLPAAFRTIADIFAGRATGRANWVQMILPPFLFVFVAFVALGTITALMGPLLDLITKLS